MSAMLDAPVLGEGRWAAALGIALLWNLSLGEPPPALSLRAWMGALARRIARVARGPWGAALLLLAVPGLLAAAGWSLLAWLGAERPLAAFALTVWILACSISLLGIGRGSLAVLEALRLSTALEARARLTAWTGPMQPPEERDELVAATIATIARRTSEELFAPLLWFVLLGVPGALLDLGLRVLRDTPLGRGARVQIAPEPPLVPSAPAEPPPPPVPEPVSFLARLHDVFASLPARLATLLLLAAARILGEDAPRGLVGAARAWARPAARSGDGPAAALVGSLGLSLGSLDPSGEAELELDEPRQPPAAARIHQAWRVACLAAASWSALMAFTLWSAGGPLLELVRR